MFDCGVGAEAAAAALVQSLFPLTPLNPQNPPNRETQISRNLAVQSQMEILIECEFVPGNFSF